MYFYIDKVENYFNGVENYRVRQWALQPTRSCSWVIRPDLNVGTKSKDQNTIVVNICYIARDYVLHIIIFFFL